MSSTILSPSISHQIPRRSPRRQARQPSIAPKKTYGKRKTNVPRAIFAEENSKGSHTRRKVGGDIGRLVEEVTEELTSVDTERPVSSQEESLREGARNKCVKEDPEAKPAIPVDTREVDSKDGAPAQEEMANEYVETHMSTKSAISAPKQKEMEELLEKMAEARIANNEEPEEISQSDAYTSPQRSPQRKANPAKKPKRRNNPRISSGCIQDIKTNTYVRPILEEVMSGTRSVQKFSSWATYAEDKFDVEKIAEGSYGEVYQLHLREEAIPKGSISKSRLEKLRSYGDGVFKIVPVRAKSGVGSKKFTTVGEIVSEVQMLKLLDEVPGFARFREVHVVQGRFPPRYQAAWWKYRDTKEDCLNPDPAKKASYPDTQLWAILEMNNAGCELEKFPWSSTFQIYDIFWGVAMALARAEQLAGFEHRDLHLGNVCVKSTRPDGNMHVPVHITEKLLKRTTGFGISGLETTLIDYSLSRAELVSSENPEWINIAASDLDKKKIFDAIGRDEDEKLLRDTYRCMRAQVYKGDPLDTNQARSIPGQWEIYCPRTNLIWLLFLLKSLLKNRKPEAVQHSARQPLGDRSANEMIRKKGTKSKEYPSQNECPGPESSVISDLQAKLLDRLHTVLDLLDLKQIEESMWCAGDLVAFAIDSQWLEENDFLCDGD